VSQTSSQSDESLPLSQARRIDEACNAFELAWQAGQRPRIEDVVGDRPEPERSVLLHELIALEMAYRQRAGEQPQPAEYQARFPDLAPSHRPTFADAEGARAAAEISGLPDIPGYEMLRELGRGGMAVVYWAWQERLHRGVALKMILSGAHAGPQELARFRTEAEAVARLQHPNVVQIYDVGQHEGQVYLALEHVDGPSLARALAGIPWPARRAAELAQTLARAVHHVHQQGIVHRDLTPANVLLTRAGVPKVSDFGLAKILVGSGPTLTHTGAFLGTPSYAAPEQAAGETRRVGPATDVYALGAILYEMLTGRPPFKAETALATLAQVQTQEPVSPSRLQPGVPRDLTTICLKCLHKEPRKRYDSALALAEDLRRFLAGEPIRARPVGRAERLWRWSRRNPVVATLVAAVVVLLVTLTAGALIKNAQLSAALHLSEEANTRERQRLWESRRDEARALRMSRHPGQRVRSLEAIREALQLPLPPGHSLDELRTEAIAAFALPDLEVLGQWDGCVLADAVSFDGRLERYARLERHGRVSVRRVSDSAEIAGCQEEVEWPWPHDARNLRLSPDGRCVCTYNHRTGRLTVRRLDGPQAVLCHEVSNSCSRSAWLPMDFSPDSKRLAYITADTRIAVVDLASGQTCHLPPTQAEQDHIHFAPDDRRFAVAVRRGGQWSVEVRDVSGGAVLQRLPHPQQPTYSAWHPDGRTLATCCEDRLIRLWDVPSGRLIRELAGHRHLGVNCVFSHAGDLLLSNNWHSVLRVWEPSSGRQLLSLPAGGYASLRATPDDRVCAIDVADTTKLQLVRLHPGLAYHTLSVRGGVRALSSRDCQVQRDSRLLAVPTGNGSVALVDLKAGREVGTLPVEGGRALLWQPSGDLLTYGKQALLRWPVRAEPGGPVRYHIGPPQRLLGGTRYAGWGISADTRVVAIPRYNAGAVVVRPQRPGHEIPLQPQQDVRECAVSPDGLWVATGSHAAADGLGAKVWEAATGRLVKELPATPPCPVDFSPDGRWLLTTGGGCRLWEVGSWKEWRKVGGARGCFSPDGSLLAVEDSAGAIRLVRTESGAEMARLEAPEQTRLIPRHFTPDGTRLIAAGVDTLALHVWDLRALRAQLAELGLDWDQPPYPAPSADNATEPLEVTIDPGNLK
jgi:WD40 repeat protein